MLDFTSAPMARQITLRTVMRTAMEQGPISRAELARLTGLSKQTMSEVFRTLEEGGWLEVTGHARGSVGRSATLYEVQPRRALVFGADVGGTKIEAALADMNGALVAETTEATDPRGGEHVLAQIANLCDRLVAEAEIPRERVAVGAVGVAGAYNPKTRALAMVPNISGLAGPDFDARLARHLGFETLVDNDVNMAAKGEKWRGAGRNLSSFVFIALGTGIGMGIINDGEIVRGAHGAAGEIATLPIGADPFDARTFHAGALETSIGSAGIGADYAGRTGQADVSVREIMDRARAGEDAARATVDAVGRTLASAILAVCAVVDPERVVLGGSVGAREELRARVLHHLALCMANPPQCTISALGGRAALYGTIAHSLDRLRDHLFALRGHNIWAASAVAESAR
ncbi:ROK family transcriptional regulator [Acuticoccus kandeliae]|uniref:ROK family transcriptional regulator n=1 Tax=Acuticoccus kandeliae TaxID=2073160 RepID=UPI000D3E85CC|nr:ROK family transcriptional regulator [Acuticoccus kandeliae]